MENRKRALSFCTCAIPIVSLKRMSQFDVFVAVAIVTLMTCQCILPGSEDKDRKHMGKIKFEDLRKKSEMSLCWKNAVSQLNSTCKLLTDTEQSRLAVGFANCHLQKSGRQTYPCDNLMSIRACTVNMNPVAFQTYTEFFTHTGHICYFLQSELWHERTENILSELSETSSATVTKLKKALDHHKVIEKKQNEVLGAFQSMEEMAHRQRDLLSEVYASLKSSVDGVHYLMSLFLVELIGVETMAVLILSWVVIIFLPRFGYSRLYMNAVLFCEQGMEAIVRKIYRNWILDSYELKTDDISSLYYCIWQCRYSGFLIGLTLYLWNWLRHVNPVQRNLYMLEKLQGEIQELNSNLKLGGGAVTLGNSNYCLEMDRPEMATVPYKPHSQDSSPFLSPRATWRIKKYLKCLPSAKFSIRGLSPIKEDLRKEPASSPNFSPPNTNKLEDEPPAFFGDLRRKKSSHCNGNGDDDDTLISPDTSAQSALSRNLSWGMLSPIPAISDCTFTVLEEDNEKEVVVKKETPGKAKSNPQKKKDNNSDDYSQHQSIPVNFGRASANNDVTPSPRRHTSQILIASTPRRYNFRPRSRPGISMTTAIT